MIWDTNLESSKNDAMVFKGYDKAEMNKGPINVLGTTPGKSRWSYLCKSVPWYKMSWQAWRLKLSSTFVKGQKAKWNKATTYGSHSIHISDSQKMLQDNLAHFCLHIFPCIKCYQTSLNKMYRKHQLLAKMSFFAWSMIFHYFEFFSNVSSASVFQFSVAMRQVVKCTLLL